MRKFEDETRIRIASLSPAPVWFALALAITWTTPRVASADVYFESAKLDVSNPGINRRLGAAVAVDGERVLAAAPTSVGSGQAFAFELQVDGEWVEVQVLSEGSDDLQFGSEVSLDGDRLAIAAPGFSLFSPNSVYLFERQADGLWLEVERLFGEDPPNFDSFGSSIDLDGDRLAVATSEGGEAVILYERDGAGSWLEVERILGLRGDLDLEGDRLAAVGDNPVPGGDSEAVFVYARQADGQWAEEDQLAASDGEAGDAFGHAVSLNGDRIVVGAWLDSDTRVQNGSAYVFERQPDASWLETAKLVPADSEERDFFGSSVALLGDRLFVGAPGIELFFQTTVGAVYLYEMDSGGSWIEQQTLEPSDGALGDAFGFAIDFDGTTLAVGAPSHAEDGDSSGAVYLFAESTVSPQLLVTGACPGEITIDLSGVTPSSPVVLLSSADEGLFIPLGGPCPGTELGLDEPAVLTFVDSDANGDAFLTPTVPSSACGFFLQVVDQTTCTPSSTAQIDPARREPGRD